MYFQAFSTNPLVSLTSLENSIYLIYLLRNSLSKLRLCAKRNIRHYFDSLDRWIETEEPLLHNEIIYSRQSRNSVLLYDQKSKYIQQTIIYSNFLIWMISEIPAVPHQHL